MSAEVRIVRLAAAAGAVVIASMAVVACGSSAARAPDTSPSSARSPTSSPSPSASAGPHAVLRAYWKDIAAGRFRAAFAKFDRAGVRRSHHGQQWFVNDKASDAPIKVRLQLGTTVLNGPFATVPIVLLQTIGSRTGCHHWTGFYRLRDINSRWLIDDASNLHKRSCY
ncbi:MAG TPA: hypothetical protein VI160_08995 [Gemmatimonadales bacterium]